MIKYNSSINPSTLISYLQWNDNGSIWDSGSKFWSLTSGQTTTAYINNKNLIFPSNYAITAGTITMNGFTTNPTVNDITFNSTAVGTFNISGGTINKNTPYIYCNQSATINSELVSTTGLTVLGNGYLTLGGNPTGVTGNLYVGSNGSPFTTGNVKIDYSLFKASFGDYIYVNKNSTLLLNTTNNQGNVGGSASKGYIVCYGNGTGSTSGIYLNSGVLWNCSANAICVIDNPTIIRMSGSTGYARLHGYDGNMNHVFINAGASGTIIDSNIKIYPGQYITLFSAYAGTLNSTGDLTINGELLDRGLNPSIGIINGGSLAITSQSSGYTSNLIMYGLGSTLIFKGSSSLGSGTTANYVGNINFNGTNNVFKWLSSSEQILSGILGGATGMLVKSGTSTLTLNNSGNTYNGTTTINQGTFKLSSGATFNGTTYSGNIINNGTFEFNSSTNQTLSGIISGTGNFNYTSSGQLTINGNNTYSGNTSIKPSANVTSIFANTSRAFGYGDISIYGTNMFNNSIQFSSGLTISNNITMIRGYGSSYRATISLGASSTISGNVTVDNTSNNGQSSIAFAGGSSTPCIISGNIGFSVLGTVTPAFVLRGGSSYGKVTGQISLSTGQLQTLDSARIEFSNTANTYGTLNIANSSGFVYCGALNTLSPTGIIIGTAGSILRLSNMANTSAFDQTIKGISTGVKVDVTTGSATLTINNSSNYTADSVISGAVSIIKSGTGIQTLSGTNTLTGTIDINEGTILIIGNNALGTSIVNVNSGGTLNKNGYTPTNTINNNGGTIIT
jgi:autotransporter-associated beta strand protein